MNKLKFFSRFFIWTSKTDCSFVKYLPICSRISRFVYPSTRTRRYRSWRRAEQMQSERCSGYRFLIRRWWCGEQCRIVQEGGNNVSPSPHVVAIPFLPICISFAFRRVRLGCILAIALDRFLITTAPWIDWFLMMWFFNYPWYCRYFNRILVILTVGIQYAVCSKMKYIKISYCIILKLNWNSALVAKRSRSQ